MARIDKGLIRLVGRDRENPRTHRDAFQITGGLGKMLDKHVKRNNLNKSEFIREAIAAKLEAEMPKEPLIKDERIRKAVRAWAEANDIDKVCVQNNYCLSSEEDEEVEIVFASPVFKEYADYDDFIAVDELCGEEEE